MHQFNQRKHILTGLAKSCFHVCCRSSSSPRSQGDPVENANFDTADEQDRGADSDRSDDKGFRALLRYISSEWVAEWQLLTQPYLDKVVLELEAVDAGFHPSLKMTICMQSWFSRWPPTFIPKLNTDNMQGGNASCTLRLWTSRRC